MKAQYAQMQFMRNFGGLRASRDRAHRKADVKSPEAGVRKPPFALVIQRDDLISDGGVQSGEALPLLGTE